MKAIKKIVASIATVVFSMLVFTGCNNNTTTNKKTTNKTTTSSISTKVTTTRKESTTNKKTLVGETTSKTTTSKVTTTKKATTSKVTTCKKYNVIFYYESGEEIGRIEVMEGGKVVFPNISLEGVSFDGWFNGEIKWELDDIVNDNISLILHVTKLSYAVSVDNKNPEMGTVTGEGSYEYGSNVTLTANPNEGYDFVCWKDGENEITSSTYNFVMGNKEKEIEALFKAKENIVYQVEHYYETTSGVYPNFCSEKESLTGATGELTNAVAKNVDQFTAVPFEQKTINPDGSTVVKIYYRRATHKITFVSNIEDAGNVRNYNNLSSAEFTLYYGDNDFYTVEAEQGYNFVCWKDGETEITDTTYSFDMGKEDVTVEVIFAPRTDIHYNVYVYEQDVEGDYPGAWTSKHEYDNGTYKELAPVLSLADLGYSDGFSIDTYDNSKLYWDGSTRIDIYVKRNINNVTTTNTDSLGTYTELTNESYLFGSTVTLTAIANQGYKFVGWYNGEELVSEDAIYSFTMPNNDVNLEAKFAPRTDIHYAIETYYQNTDGTYPTEPTDKEEYDNGVMGEKIPEKVALMIMSGYFLQSYENNDIKADGTAVDIIRIGRSSYSVTTSTNILEAGTYTELNNASYLFGSTVTLTAIANQGYKFVGWYKGEDLVSEDSTYSFKMGSTSISLEAKFDSSTVTLTLEVNNSDYGTVSGAGTYNCLARVTVTATPSNDYLFAGWYKNNILVCTYTSYTFTINDDLTLEARFSMQYDFVLNYDSSKGTASYNGTALGGNNISLYAEPKYGYLFAGWANEDGDIISTNDVFTYTMPNHSVIITAKFCEIEETCSLHISEGLSSYYYGRVRNYATNSSIKKNDYVILSINIDSNTSFVGWYEVDDSDNHIYLSSDPEFRYQIVGDTYLFAQFSKAGFVIDEEGYDNFVLANNSTGYTIVGIKDTGIEELYIPDDVTAIDKNTFPLRYCYNIKSFSTKNIGDDISLSDATADNIDPNATIEIRSGCTRIGEYAFGGFSGMKSIEIPNTVTSIGSYAFYGCAGLESITMPESLIEIEGYAFSGCTGLKSFTLPKNVEKFGTSYVNGVLDSIKNPLKGCLNIETLEVEEGNIYFYSQNNGIYSGTTILSACNNTVLIDTVTTIGKYAFAGLSSLDSVVLPNSVERIDSNAFAETGLSGIDFNNVKYIGTGAFSTCPKITEVYIPSGIIEIGDNPYCSSSNIESIIVDENNLYYDSRNNCNAIIEKATDKLVTACKNTIIPDNIKIIGNSAFWEMDYTSLVDLPEGLIAIEDYAFMMCSGIYEYSLPSTIQTIGEGAFFLCNGDTAFVIPQSVQSIGQYAFNVCWMIQKIYNASDVPEDDFMMGAYAVVYKYSETAPTEAGNYFHFDANGKVVEW